MQRTLSIDDNLSCLILGSFTRMTIPLKEGRWEGWGGGQVVAMDS